MQDESGLDANMILYLLFAASGGRSLNEAAVGELDGFVADWRRTVVWPLRSVRRALKGANFCDAKAAQKLRNRIKSDELEAERMQQEAMYRFAEGLAFERASPMSAAQSNLDRYRQCLGRALPPAANAGILAEFADFMRGDGEARER